MSKKMKLSHLALILFSGMTLAHAADDTSIPCAIIEKAGEEAQIIPAKGKIETRLKKDDAVACGSSIVTHAHEIWIRKKDQNLVRIARDTFFELGVKDPTGEAAVSDKLLRGQILISGEHVAAEGESPTHIVSPNAVLDFRNGTTYYSYDAKAKESTVVCFSKSVQFKNRYQLDASQTLKTAEMSHLTVGSARLIPSQPELVSPSGIKENLALFSLSEKETAEFSHKVVAEFESRGKSLTADIENWRDIAEDTAEIKPVEKAEEIAPKREIASTDEGQKAANSQKHSALGKATSIEPEEAANTLDILKKRLYGDAEDLKLVEDAPKTRGPASVSENAGLSDPVYEKEQHRKKTEVKKLVNGISELNP